MDIRKYPGTVTPLENGDQKVMWNITGTVPAGVNSFKIVDNIREPLYGVKTQLETAIRNNLRLTMEGGTTLTWAQAVDEGIQIQLSFFPTVRMTGTIPTTAFRFPICNRGASHPITV